MSRPTPAEALNKTVIDSQGEATNTAASPTSWSGWRQRGVWLVLVAGIRCVSWQSDASRMACYGARPTTWSHAQHRVNSHWPFCLGSQKFRI